MKAKVKEVQIKPAYTQKGSVRNEYKWKSEKHEEAMDGIIPEDDPLNLYGEWVKVEYPDEIIEHPETYDVFLSKEEDDVIWGGAYTDGTNNIFICLNDEFVLTRLGSGECLYKVGDEIELELISQAYLEA